jgi:hypothetical protein
VPSETAAPPSSKAPRSHRFAGQPDKWGTFDGPQEQWWSTAKMFLACAPGLAFAVMTIGPVLLLPVPLFAFVVPQWPVLAVIVAALAVITVIAMRGARPRSHLIDPMVIVITVAYTAVFGAMVVANTAHEGGITAYLIVQAVGLAGVATYASWPLWAPERLKRRDVAAFRRARLGTDSR